jgi:tetratricopeptide (TPR) repeat protein
MYKQLKQIFFFIGLLILVQAAPVFAQQNTLELANQYFSTKEFDKAVVYYEKAYSNDPFGVYPKYLKCLFELKAFEDAEKVIKKQIKKIPTDPTYKLDLAKLYETLEQKDKADKIYQDLIKNIAPDIAQVNSLGAAFLQRQQYEYAEQTYLQGKKKLNGTYPFSFELAEVYSQQGKDVEMINEYIEMLAFNPSYLPNIQTILQNKIGNDVSGATSDQVRVALLRKIQKNPEETTYAELLYWLFLQDKDYESAFIQARGLDKRLGENGQRLISLGILAENNLEYETAEKCFQYVVDLGKGQPNYVNARMKLLLVSNARITNSGKYTSADLAKLDSDYQITLQELGRTSSTAPLIRGYAHLKAFYLYKTDDAIELLEETINLPNLQPQYRAEAKLEMADIYVFRGEVWDAALLYGQVDKEFKNDALGREAKFRNARLSYYIGEFDWAKDQLLVLKTATSQLISNDALSLSLLISDNTNMDTSNAALLAYSKADLLDFQNKDSLSLILLDSILVAFPNHTLTDEIYYKKAQIYKQQRNFLLVDSMLRQVVEKYSEDVLADDALFQLGDINENILNNKENAQKYYELLLTKYPGSLYGVDARKRFRKLRGDKLN